MKQEDIIRMARQADPKANLSEPYCLDHETRAWLERFAALVAAAEREACAKACEEIERKATNQPPMVGQGCQACAYAIRARGQSQVCCEEYNTCVRACTPRGRHHGQKEEREACAKQLDALGCDHCAAAIRARGQA